MARNVTLNSAYWTARVHRRSLLRSAGTAGIGLTGLALLACGGSTAKNNAPTAAATQAGPQPSAATPGSARQATPGTAATAAADAPKRGGDYVYPVSSAGSAGSLDPQQGLSPGIIFPLIADQIVKTDNQKVEPIQPSLAERWEQADPLSIVMTVRQGVTWHQGKITNGRPYTAKDMAFQIERMAGLNDASRKPLFLWSTLIKGVTKAEAIDDKTVRVSFSTPNALFLNGLAYLRQWPVAPENVDKDPDFKRPADFAGTGPYIIQSYDDLLRGGTYTANPNYWKKGQPYFATVSENLALNDSASRVAAFISKKFPLFSMYNVAPTTLDTLKQNRPDAKVYKWEYLGWDHFRFNQQKDAFKDPRARQALFLAINYQEVADAGYLPGNWDYTGPLPAGLAGAWTSDQVKAKPGWNPATKQQDIANAKKLLEAAGFPNGKGMSFAMMLLSDSTLGDDGIRIKGQLEQAFPEIKITVQSESTNFGVRQNKGDYDSETSTSYPPFSAFLEAGQHYRTNGGRNYTGWSDPEADALIDKGLTEFDANARNQIVGQLEQKLLDDMFMVPIGKPKSIFVYDPKLRGVEQFVGFGTGGHAFDPTFVIPYLWYA